MSEVKPTLNVYGVFDNEMARMHDLLKHIMTLPPHMQTSHGRGMHYNHDPYPEIAAVYSRIMEMQTVVVNALTGRDQVIQDKVAEMALTGVEQDAYPR